MSSQPSHMDIDSTHSPMDVDSTSSAKDTKGPNGTASGEFVSNNMGALAAEHPELMEAIKKSIAMNMMNESKHSNERVIQRMKEARYDNQKAS